MAHLAVSHEMWGPEEASLSLPLLLRGDIGTSDGPVTHQ